MTTKKNQDLTPAEVAAFGVELDAIRTQVLASLGEGEARYIRRVQASVRYTEIAGRALLMLGWFPPAWVAGTGLLSFSKIAENMELGHNVMHGQYDWLNEPSLRGDTYEWDTACHGAAWRHSHNYLHHTFTNVHGKDRDIGYGILRLFPEQKWEPTVLLQPVHALALAFFFQWGVALHDLEIEKVRSGEKTVKQIVSELPPVLRKAARQLGKDYLFFPVLAGPAFLPVFTGNLIANMARNLWAFAIIFCGHFTEHAETFEESVLAHETRGDWYLRQLRGSSNLQGGKAFHFMSGNLSHQIEHHLFPNIPAIRYVDLAPRVQEICERYGQHYNTGSFRKQLTSVVKRIFKYSLPSRNQAPARVTPTMQTV